MTTEQKAAEQKGGAHGSGHSRRNPEPTVGRLEPMHVDPGGRRSVGLVGVVQMAFIRIGADPRISDHPFTIADATHHV